MIRACHFANESFRRQEIVVGSFRSFVAIGIRKNLPFMSSSGQIFEARRRVEFRDTDAAGIMHFSTFFTYMEQVEHEFLRSLGKSVMPAAGAGHGHSADHVSWPRVAASCDYRVPLRFEDEFDVQLRIRRLGTKSVEFGFEFRRGEQLCAEGSLTVVCCRILPGQAPKSVPIPDDFRVRLEPFVMADKTN